MNPIAMVILGPIVLAGGLALASRRHQRQLRRHNEAQQEFLRRVGRRLGLADDGLPRGEISGRAVRLKDGFAHIRVDIPAVALDLQICQWDDGPYQKKEVLFDGTAHPTGDPEFDTRYLASGSLETVESITEDLRRTLLEQVVPDVRIRRDEVSLFLPFELEAAVAVVLSASALCDALVDLPTR